MVEINKVDTGFGIELTIVKTEEATAVGIDNKLSNTWRSE